MGPMTQESGARRQESDSTGARSRESEPKSEPRPRATTSCGIAVWSGNGQVGFAGRPSRVPSSRFKVQRRQEVGSQESGVRGQESGVGSQGSGVGSQGSGV